MSSPVVHSAVTSATHYPEPHLDVLMLFGFLIAFGTIVIALHPNRSANKMLVFSLCLAGCSVYGFLQGAWPLGFTEGAWSIVSLHRWFVSRRPRQIAQATDRDVHSESVEESRMERMFGPS